MNFAKKLNEYIELLDCTAKELAETSGLSAATLSRYRTGSRLPDSEHLEMLSSGIERLAKERGEPRLKKEQVMSALNSCILPKSENFELLPANLDSFLTLLNINARELATFVNYDASSISRIRKGKRLPGDPKMFASQVAQFVSQRYNDPEDRGLLANLFSCTPEELSVPEVYAEKILHYLLYNSPADSAPVLSFLSAIDEFDLNEYMRSLHFDTLKVPSVPFQLPISRDYYGLEQMHQGEYDFFKAVILSKSKEPLIMNSDMPVADLAALSGYMKKNMQGMAMALKKGLHVNMIHHVDRSFEEVIMGLTAWVPLYMTGLVSPFYLKGYRNSVFGHLLFSAGTVALSGECVMGSHEEGRYHLTGNRQEVSYYRKRAEALLKKAYPLMNIYQETDRKALSVFLLADLKTSGTRSSVLSSPPLYTMPEEMLRAFLQARSISSDRQEEILGFAAHQRQFIQEILSHSKIHDTVPELSPEEISNRPPLLPISAIFYENSLPYTPEEYQAHVRASAEFARRQPNYSFCMQNAWSFRNINIVLHAGKWAMISKNKSPAAHFIVHHPKLLGAIENMLLRKNSGGGVK